MKERERDRELRGLRLGLLLPLRGGVNDLDRERERERDPLVSLA